MLPPAHLGVAYLGYTIFTRLVDGKPPIGRATIALLVGGALPDLIDLPLHYLAGAPNTRTIGHSAFVGTGVSVIVWLAMVRLTDDDRAGVAFAFGYLFHLLADAVWPIVLWVPEELRYLGWPLTRQPAYEGVKPLTTVGSTTVTTAWVELVLVILATAVWWYDGRPGYDR